MHGGEGTCLNSFEYYLTEWYIKVVKRGELEQKLLDQIAKIGHGYAEIKRIVLFGSRARGDNAPSNDIDLAIYLYSNTFTTRSRFVDEIEKIDTRDELSRTF